MTINKLNISIIPNNYAVCKLNEIHDFNQLNKSDFFSVTKTNDEISVVAEEKHMDICENCEKGWKIFKIEETLDFGLTGIISSITTLLAAQKIPVFVISTYNTDYILIKNRNVKKAVKVLKKDYNILNFNPSQP